MRNKLSTNKIKALVVDDEPLARDRIRQLLKDDPDIEIIGECGNGHEAVVAIQSENPDLVFLDIQIPELNGFEVIQSIGVDKMPCVIFITAFDKFALNAFEVHALDYLLKPIDVERFQQTLARTKLFIKNIQISQLTDRLNNLLTSLKADKRYLSRFTIKIGKTIYSLKAESIDWIESAGNYVTLHAGSKKHIYRTTMKCLENILDPEKFVRIHRTRIVNIDAIKELHQFDYGGFLIILKNGQQLPLSSSYRQNLLQFF
jgi:two-component system LytT family response regulator